MGVPLNHPFLTRTHLMIFCFPQVLRVGGWNVPLQWQGLLRPQIWQRSGTNSRGGIINDSTRQVSWGCNKIRILGMLMYIKKYFTSCDPHHDIYTFSYWQIFWHSIWHIFWHSIWHIFWHSIWQIFWHIFWHSIWHCIWHIFWHSIWHIFWHILCHIFWHCIWHSI